MCGDRYPQPLPEKRHLAMLAKGIYKPDGWTTRLASRSCRMVLRLMSPAYRRRIRQNGAAPPGGDRSERGQEIFEGLIGSRHITRGLDVHDETADDREHEGGEFGTADASHAVLERLQPVCGGLAAKARPQLLLSILVELAEHAEVRAAGRAGHDPPSPSQSAQVGLVRSWGQQFTEEVALAPPRPSQGFPQQRVPGPEVVDQHPGRSAGRRRERLEPAGQPVRERVIDAGVEDPVADLGLLVPSHHHTFSRNWRYVYH